MSRRNKRKTKKLQKKYWGIVSAKQLRKKKMRVFRKKNKLDRKAVEIAKKIHHDPYRMDYEDNNKTIKVDTCSLWDMYADYNLQVMKCLLSVIRKAIVDGFPIENTYLHEIPYWDKELLIADFVNKDDFPVWIHKVKQPCLLAGLFTILCYSIWSCCADESGRACPAPVLPL